MLRMGISVTEKEKVLQDILIYLCWVSFDKSTYILAHPEEKGQELKLPGRTLTENGVESLHLSKHE